jgi:hypothetical protein
MISFIKTLYGNIFFRCAKNGESTIRKKVEMYNVSIWKGHLAV